MNEILHQFYLSRFGVNVAVSLARSLSPDAAYRLARILARLIASQRRLSLVKSVRANLWVVTQGKLSSGQLDQYVEDVFRFRFQSMYDLYHHLGDIKVVKRMVTFTGNIESCFQRVREGIEGTVIVIPHLGNFDFVGQAVVQEGVRFQSLTFPRPGSGYKRENAIRKRLGMDVIPVSKDSLRQALAHLRAGGAIMTGMDRPLPYARYRPRFFDRPAPLPVLHIRLALQANVPVVVVANLKQPDRTYKMFASDPIYMQRYPRRMIELIQNAEVALNVAADFIRQAPAQWGMFYPVWPEVDEAIS